MRSDLTSHQLPLIAAKAPDHEQLNAKLRETLTGMSDTVPDRGSNRANGQSYFDKKWLSHAQLHKNEADCLQKFVSFAEAVANQKVQKPEPDWVLSIMSMWSIVSKPGLSGERHHHAGVVSGAYYVDIGASGEEHGGLLQFYLNSQSTQPTHVLTPVAGVLYLFPSMLEHSVSRYEGESQRIVISINMS